MKNRICKIVALLSLFVLLLSSPTLAMAATLSHQYDEVGYCTSDLPLIKVKKGEKVGVIDAASLKVVLPAEYDYISFSEGLFEIEKDRKTGYADVEGRIIIPCKYGYREISNYYGEMVSFAWLMRKQAKRWPLVTRQLHIPTSQVFQTAWLWWLKMESVDLLIILGNWLCHAYTRRLRVLICMFSREN